MKYTRCKFVLFLAFLASTASSCKKDNGSSSSVPPGPRIKTVILPNKQSVRYSYDEKWRASSIVYSYNGRDNDKDIYLYTDTSAVQRIYDSTGVLTKERVYNLNASGLAISATYPDFPDGQTFFTYNAAGQNIFYSYVQRTSGQPDRLSNAYFFYSKGNLDSARYTQTGGTTYVSYYYEYYTDRPNTLGNENHGLSFLGGGSKNPPKTARLFGSPNTLTYQYEYDQQNRITKEIHLIVGTSDTTVYTYY